MGNRVRGQRGFSLMELMITLVIIGILAAIAYPMYQTQVRKARRTDGILFVQELAQRMERTYTRANTYPLDLGTLFQDGGANQRHSPDGWYEAEVMVPKAFCRADRGCYRLLATPQGAHDNASEPRLILWSTGRRQHRCSGALKEGWLDCAGNPL